MTQSTVLDDKLLDLSNWDADTFNAPCFYASGVRRVIIAGERWSTASQVERSQAAGINVIGLYVYIYWDADVLARVNLAIGHANRYGVPYVWLDCEDSGGTVYSRLSWLRNAVAVIEGAGLRAGIYTAGWWWVPSMENSTEFRRLPLWHAQYGVGGSPRPPVTAVAYGGWTAPHIHQYSSTVVCCGRVRDHNYLLRELPGLEDDVTEDQVRALIAEERERWIAEYTAAVGANPVRHAQAVNQRLWAINKATDPQQVPGG